MKNEIEEKKEKTIKEIEEYSKNWSGDGWVVVVLFALIFGFNGKSPEIDALKERVSKLEAKNEIIEKLVTK